MVCFVIFTITKEFLTTFQSMKVSESTHLAVKFKNSIINKEVKKTLSSTGPNLNVTPNMCKKDLCKYQHRDSHKTTNTS